MSPNEIKHSDDRRRFLRTAGLSVLGGLLLGSQPLVGTAQATSGLGQTALPAPQINTARSLILNNIHTGERLNCAFGSANSYDPAALSAIDRLMRDHRTGDIHPIDPRLLDLMNAIADRLQVAPAFEIVSGFRSEKTNQALRNQGRNVARKSYHMLGQAVDVRMPGVSTTRLHQAALALRQGGVGLYRGPGFVHVDTGPVRTW